MSRSDAAETIPEWIRAVAEATGWRIHHKPTTASTNDDAALLLKQGASSRTAVVADHQQQGRGRRGRSFASPAGGLYVSILCAAPSDGDPAPLVAAAAVAVAEAIEVTTRLDPQIKWPNDVWIDDRKVAGILLERADAHALAVAGIGINLAGVPDELSAEVAATVTSLAEATAGRPPEMGALLQALLAGIDRHTSALATVDGRADVEQRWRDRLALRGAAVTYAHGGAHHHGTLEDASFERGLLIRGPAGGIPVWLPGAHVSDLRPV